MPRILLLVVGLALVGGLVWLAATKITPSIQTITIESDTATSGDYAVEPKTRVVLKRGAHLSVNGNLSVNGELSCEEGVLNVTASGNAVIDGKLSCDRGASSLPEGDAGTGISLVVEGALVFGKDAAIVSNGHVQIVSSADRLASTKEGFEALFADAAINSGPGPRLGPLVPDEEGTRPSGARIPAPQLDGGTASSAPIPILNGIVHTARAQGAPAPCADQNGNVVPGCVRLSGNWFLGGGGPPPPGVSVPTPPPGVNKIVLNFNFGPGKEVHLSDFTLSGPDGRRGTDDRGNGCNARGGKGEDAFRMRVQASNIRVNNFSLWLGNGGDGGDAETKKDCDPGTATGGNGGEAGNFKMSATGTFEIAGAFNIFPGRGGNGGSGTAHGKDGDPGCPGKKGGDATATGGNGGPNRKKLSAIGSVTGLSNVTIDEVQGGEGGLATANPGKGGGGTGCNCDGGPGGKGTATGGKGGDAAVTALGASGTATGGDGGDADSEGGRGGDGGQGSPICPGGDGGKGGDTSSKAGKGGAGTSANGADGTVVNEKGGDGGNGGDGCNEGKGGKGGQGKPNGNDGKPGKNLCTPLTPPAPATSITPPPPASVAPSPTPTPATGGYGGTTPKTKAVQTIRYQGKYLPVDQLIVENEAGCGADHWHAAESVVRATDGTMVPDPGPQCGYGKVAENPVMTIEIQE